MNLTINKVYNKSTVEDTVSLSCKMLSQPGAHLFIAAHKWDCVDIEICDDINPEDLRYIHTVTDTIKSHIGNDINDKEVQCLCMLYPKQAGTIRMAYMSGANLSEAVNDIEICTN